VENGLLEGSYVKSQKEGESTVNETEANFYERTQWTWVKAEIISILSASYSLEKNTCSGGGVTSFRDRAQTCTGFVHVISRLISLLVDL